MTLAQDAEFDVEALRWFAARRRERRRRALVAVAAQAFAADTDTARATMRHLFGLDRQCHFLRTTPSLLDRQHEPQVTRTLRNYLLDPMTRRTRAQAVFDAVVGADVVSLASVEPPAADTVGRIDLLIAGVTVGGDHTCLAIEAKFSHRLCARQLTDYRRRAVAYLGDRAIVPPARTVTHLVVIAASLRENDAALLRNDRNRGIQPAWRFRSWRRFLLDVDAALPDDRVHDDFRTYLRLIWSRADDC